MKSSKLKRIKNVFTFLLLFFILVQNSVWADSFYIDKNHRFSDRGGKEFVNAYNYLLGQNYGLEKFRAVYPTEINEVEKLFNDAFPDLFKKMTAIFVNERSEEYVFRRKKALLNQLSSDQRYNPEINLQNLTLVQNDMKNRAAGNIQHEILRPFLTVIYGRNYEKEMSDGYKNLFNGTGHPKSRQLKIRINTPISWYAREGANQHVLQKWQPMNGGVNELYSIEVYPLSYLGLSMTKYGNNPIQVFISGGIENFPNSTLISRKIRNDITFFQKPVLNYVMTLTDIKMKLHQGDSITQKEADAAHKFQLYEMNAFVKSQHIVITGCKKGFRKELPDDEVETHLKDLKNKCNTFSNEIRFY